MSQVRGARTSRWFAVAATLAVASLAFHAVASHGAGIEEIEATGEYHLGDRDTKIEGHQLAVVEAQRVALEKAGTYLESVSEVRDLQVTHDEIRSYSAGILKTTEVGEPQWTMVRQNLVVRVRARVRVDKDDVVKHIAALRADEETARKLREASTKIQELEGVIADQNRKLPAATASAALQLRQARTQALSEIGEKRDSASQLAMAAVELYGKAQSGPGGWVHGHASPESRTRARSEIEQALKVDPEDPRALHEMGNLAIEEGNASKAEEFYRHSLRARPNAAATRAALGYALYQQGKRAAAIDEEREAIRLDPNLASAHVNLASFLQTTGHSAEADEEYHQANRLSPGSAAAHLARAGSLYESACHHGLGLCNDEKLGEAIREAREAIRLAPDMAVAHHNLGVYYREWGNPAGAAEEYQEALRLNPSDAYAREQREAALSEVRSPLFGCMPRHLGEKGPLAATDAAQTIALLVAPLPLLRIFSGKDRRAGTRRGERGRSRMRRG